MDNIELAASLPASPAAVEKAKKPNQHGFRPKDSKNKKRQYANDELFRIPMWDSKMLALFLGVSEITVRAWRVAGNGPPYIKLSKYFVRYNQKDVLDWLAKPPQKRGVA